MKNEATKILYNSSSNELDGSAINIIEETTETLLENKEFLVIAIPGGRSVVGIFKLFKETNYINWKKIHIFMLDERLVPPGDRESNFKLAKDLFIDELIKNKSIPPGNIHPFIYNKKALSLGINDYRDELKKFSGSYDIILLSSGEDGHIGGLYPDHHSIRDDSKYYITMNNSPKPPTDRMSSSRKLMLRSKIAIALFLGEGKKKAFQAFNDPGIDYVSCPAKIINQIERSFVLSDIKPKDN